MELSWLLDGQGLHQRFNRIQMNRFCVTFVASLFSRLVEGGGAIRGKIIIIILVLSLISYSVFVVYVTQEILPEQLADHVGQRFAFLSNGKRGATRLEDSIP